MTNEQPIYTYNPRPVTNRLIKSAEQIATGRSMEVIVQSRKHLLGKAVQWESPNVRYTALVTAVLPEGYKLRILKVELLSDETWCGLMQMDNMKVVSQENG